MKKLADGTEYLFREETRDKDGNLVKSVRYAEDGKTIERVREFKMFPAGMNTPARNVVASEIVYGKNGEVIRRRTAHPDGLGYDIAQFLPKENAWVTFNYVTHLDGNRFRPQAVSGFGTDAKTGLKRAEFELGPKGEDDIVSARCFDKKTGTKVVKERQRINDNTYKNTEFGQGQSRRVSVMRGSVGKEDCIHFEQYDSQGRLRKSFIKNNDGSTVTKIIDKKGRERIIETRPDGENIVRRTYKKDGHEYIITNESDGGFSLRRDGVDIGDIKRSYAPQEASFRFPDYELTYDENGRKLKKVVIDDDLRIEITYDEFGQVATRASNVDLSSMI